jgi:branched-chain amino acid transport system permease protein
MNRRILNGLGAFMLGFVCVVLLGKGVDGYLIHGMKTYVPNGIYLQGVTLGCLNGLLAIGLVLVYRTNRIINFAQGELGAFAAALAVELVQRFGWPFVPAVLVSLLAAVAMAALVEFAIIRRFSKAPRLILTVATIGVFQILGAIELALPFLLNKHAKLNGGFNTPVSFHFKFGGAIFTGDYLVVLIVTPLILGGLVWFLRGTGYGLAARAAAEDGDRARLLGVRVKRVSLLVWVIAGFLSAAAAILKAPVSGFQFGAISGFTLLLQALAAAVIARMESIPVAFGAAVLISTADQVLYFGTSRQGPNNGLLLAIIIVALLVQRKRVGRLESESSSWQAVQEVRPIPAELRKLPEVRLARFGLGGLMLLVLTVLPFLLTPSKTKLASVIMIYAMVGLSLVILTGWGGNVSFGQWALVGVGALVAGKLATQANPSDFFVAMLVAGLAGAGVAVVIGLPALRIRGLFLGVTTLAFALATGSWIFTFDWLTPNGAIQRPVMFGLVDVYLERNFYFVCFAFLLATLFVGHNLRRSRFGRVLISMRDNEKASQAFGVPTVKTKLMAFAASGFVAAVAGGLYAYHEQQLRADRFPPELSLLMFSMVVIGGMGSQSGAILGALFIRGTQYFLPQQFQLLATGAGVLLLLLFFPGGLGQLFFMARDTYLRWVADRRKILVPSLVADRRVDIDLSTAAMAATGEDHLTEEQIKSHELVAAGEAK